MSQNWLKIGGMVVSIVGAGVGLASDLINKKTVTADILNSKEFKDLVAKQVEEALKSKH